MINNMHTTRYTVQNDIAVAGNNNANKNHSKPATGKAIAPISNATIKNIRTIANTPVPIPLIASLKFFMF